MPNRLANETSPYLLQHKDNPIDWHPWGEEALLRAKLEDKPIFLSIGYSSCHWCHVMAHESFEDPEVALALNAGFISIKLDREERPDLDAEFMTAVQVATGRGGWPMTLFMTPDKKPFFCGTYFPRVAKSGAPGFLNIVHSLGTAWREERAKVEDTAAQFALHLTQVLGQGMAPEGAMPTPDLFDGAVAMLAQEFDEQNGGFGSMPKFPPHSAVRFLFDYCGARPEMGVPSNKEVELDELIGWAGSMAIFTLEKMARGGIHDHVGGGFHRYSTDAEWFLPHFEKMLSDNGLLLWSYAKARDLVEDPALEFLFDRAAKGIVSWTAREMTSPEGLFYSALDADSEGEEGLFYTWTWEELQQVLGDRAEAFAEKYGCLEGGNYHDEATGEPSARNIPHLWSGEGVEAEIEALLQARGSRVRPGTDLKCLCSWNGLMISGLAAAGETEMASRCADAWLALIVDGKPPHQVTHGKPSGEPFLDDYACFIEGLIDLYEADPQAKWIEAIESLVKAMIERHEDAARGGFTYTSRTGEVIFARTKPMLDQATPSPNGVALRILGRLGLQESGSGHAFAALPWGQKMPTACETILGALLYWAAAPVGANETLPTPGPAPALDPTSVRVFLNPREVTVDQEGWGHAMVTISLPQGIHINSQNPPARWLTPTSLKVEGVWGEAGFPATENDQYEGEVNIPLRLRPKKGTDEFELTVTFQPCTDRECLPPVEKKLAGVLIVP
jgi:uncharacterized protein